MMRAVKGHDFNDVKCLCVFEVFVICTFFNERYHLFFFAWFNNYIIGFLSFSFFFFEDLSSLDE